jgi:ABC-2 type transport system permease protein
MRNSLHNIGAITGKELRSLYGSPVAWVLMGLFGFLFGWFYNVYLDYFMQQSMNAQFGGGPQSSNVNASMIRPLLSNFSVLMLFLLPIITMRTYSEEKRSGTIELLLTSPVTDVEIVFGKFLGAVGLYAGLLGVTMAYIAVLFAFGTPDWRPLVSGYLGLLLMGTCFLSIGLFISSTTKNQMVAAAASFIAALFLWIIGWFSNSVGPTLSAILSYLSITEHMDDFSKGIIDTKHVVFYLSFIAFGLFLTLKSTDAERWRG